MDWWSSRVFVSFFSRYFTQHSTTRTEPFCTSESACRTVPCVSVRTLQKLALTPVHASRCQTPICGHLPPSEPANFKRGAGMHSVVAVSISKHCMTYTAAQALWALEGPRQGEMICKAAVDPALILIICLWVRDVNDPQRFHRQPTNQVKPDRREHYSPLNRLFRAA